LGVRISPGTHFTVFGVNWFTPKDEAIIRRVGRVVNAVASKATSASGGTGVRILYPPPSLVEALAKTSFTVFSELRRTQSALVGDIIVKQRSLP
jgi:hypothetical protein